MFKRKTAKSRALAILSSLILCTGIKLPSKAAEPDPGPIPAGLQVYRMGSSSWITASTSPGLMLQGGGTDCDSAWKWMIQKGGGGDIVVIRTNDSSGYNDPTWAVLNNANSVTTLVVDTVAKANTTYVETAIKNAEVLFIAGGDQTTYYNNWKGTRVESAINYVLTTKKAVVGGTSAGMAVLTGIDYIPEDLGVYSSEALSNPYHDYMRNLKSDFLNTMPYMNNVVSDTHFAVRDRMGRFLAFQARSMVDFNISTIKGIACDEKAAVCIDTDTGIAKIFSDAKTKAYFTVSSKKPETCVSGKPLTWKYGGTAVTIWRITGNSTGSNTFNLATWSTSSVTSSYVYVDNGVLTPRRPY